MQTPDEFVEGLLDETRDEINRADTKASILLGGTGLAVASLLGTALAARISVDRIPMIGWVTAAMSALSLGTSITFFGAAVFPRMGQGSPGRARFFMDHALYDDLDDLRVAIEFEYDHMAERHLHQLRNLARIVRTKYQLSIYAEWAACIGLATAAVTALTYFLAIR